MSTKHTPGPWTIGRWEQNLPIIDASETLKSSILVSSKENWGSDIAYIAIKATDDDISVQEANARLIAAAPTMFEALEAVIQSTDINGHLDAKKMAMEAIAKAKVGAK